MKYLLSVLDQAPHGKQISDFLQEVKDTIDDKGSYAEFYETLERITNELRAWTEHSTAFLAKVRKSDAPDYFQVIKKPMDLGTVLKKVKAQQYKDKKSFHDDINLIWSNCLTYNTHPSHPLRRSAILLKGKGDHLLEFVTDPASKRAPSVAISPSPRPPTYLRRVVDSEDEPDAEGEDESDDDTLKSRKGLISKKRQPGGGQNMHLLNGLVREEPDLLGGWNSGQTNGVLTARERSQSPAVRRTPLPDEHLSASAILAKRATSKRSSPLVKRRVSATPKESSSEAPSTPAEILPPKPLTFGDKPAIARTSAGMVDFAHLDSLYSPYDQPIASTSAVTLDDPESLWESSQQYLSSESLSTSRSQLNGNAKPLRSEESWWTCMRSNKLLANGLPTTGFANENITPTSYTKSPTMTTPPKSKQKVVKKKKSINLQPSSLYGQLASINDNINSIRRIRTMYKAVSSASEAQQAEPEGDSRLLPPDDSEKLDEPIFDLYQKFNIPTTQFSPACSRESAYVGLRNTCTALAAHAGFEATHQSPLGALATILETYLLNLGRTLSHYRDRCANKMTASEMLLHTLEQNGIESPATLTRYLTEDSTKYGAKLKRLQSKLEQTVTQTFQAVDDDAFFAPESDALTSGNLMGELGEDFFGLGALGLDKEFGLANLSVPKKLLRGPKDAAPLVNGNSKPGETSVRKLRFTPPPPYPEFTREDIKTLPGLLQPFYEKRAETAPYFLLDDENVPTAGRPKVVRLKALPSGKIPIKRKAGEDDGTEAKNAKKKKVPKDSSTANP